MAIEFADDFKSYGSTPAFLLDGLYADATMFLVEDPDPLVTGIVCNFTGPFNGIRRVLSNNQTTVGVAGRFWFAALPSTGSTLPHIIRFNDSDNVTNVSIALTTTGALQAFRNTQDIGVSLGVSAPVITANAFAHIEVKVLFSQTVGTVEIRVNGIVVLALTGLDTVFTSIVSCAQVRISTTDRAGANSQVDAYLKDYVCWNGTGGNNDNFLGTVNVISLLPASDVSLNWTPSTGSVGWDLLNDSPPVDATRYISATSPPPSPAVFTLTNLPVDVTSVRALITQVRARKIDGGDGSLRTGLISNGDTGLGVDRPVSSAFAFYTDIFPTDPDTSAAWTPGAVDLANLQLNRTV